MDFVHEHYYQPSTGTRLFPPFQAHNVWQREQIMKRQFSANPSNHYPEVFALPRDHDVAPQQMLTPCEDLEFLIDKYRRDVCSLMSIPYEMIAANGRSGNETVSKTMASGRLFNCHMTEICRQLQLLMRVAYSTIYDKPKETVRFKLEPMPRMEVESIADLKILFECGMLTPDMNLKISKVLLGTEPGPKRQKVLPKKDKPEPAFI
jgi:hypothetical protein